MNINSNVTSQPSTSGVNSPVKHSPTSATPNLLVTDLRQSSENIESVKAFTDAQFRDVTSSGSLNRILKRAGYSTPATITQGSKPERTERRSTSGGGTSAQAFSKRTQKDFLKAGSLSGHPQRGKMQKSPSSLADIQKTKDTKQDSSSSTTPYKQRTSPSTEKLPHRRVPREAGNSTQSNNTTSTTGTIKNTAEATTSRAEATTSTTEKTTTSTVNPEHTIKPVDRYTLYGILVLGAAGLLGFAAYVARVFLGENKHQSNLKEAVKITHKERQEELDKPQGKSKEEVSKILKKIPDKKKDLTLDKRIRSEASRSFLAVPEETVIKIEDSTEETSLVIKHKIQ